MTLRSLCHRQRCTGTSPNTERTALRSAFDPSSTNSIPCSGSRPRSTRSDSSAVATVAFSVLPSHSPSGIFTPSVVIPSATIIIRPFSSSPSSIITASRRSRELAAHQLAERLAGPLHERPRHRRLRRRPRLRLDLLADRLLRAPIPARGDAGEHPLQHDPAQRVAISEVLDRSRAGTSVSPSAVLTRGRCTSTRRPPSVTSPSSWPCRTAVRSALCLPFGPTTSSTSSSINSVSTPSPTPTLSASSPSFAAPTNWPSASCTRSGSTASSRSPARPVRCYSRRFLLRSWSDHRERSQQERTRPEGPPSPQSSTSPGTTSC